ncbi:MAG: tail fiber protein [bacterium]|jgi:microcystin-dependent protein|nr:tail fiber protein [bacterium]
MADFYIGQIMPWAPNFAPMYWAFCDGSLLSLAQNQALYALIGTMYGGNGTTNFALPDLRGRVIVGAGQGSGLTNRSLGEKGGLESVTLTVNQLPVHNHEFRVAASSGRATTDNPVGNVPARADMDLYAASGALTQKNWASSPAGGGTPVSVMQPYLVLNYIICLQGIFPPRP